jgi:hypothetical protein
MPINPNQAVGGNACEEHCVEVEHDTIQVELPQGTASSSVTKSLCRLAGTELRYGTVISPNDHMMVVTAEVRRHKNSFTKKDWLILYASGANRNDSYCWLEIWHRSN